MVKKTQADSDELNDLEAVEDLLEDLSEETEENPKDRVSDDHFERFLNTFERSAKRWEMIVYPGMFGFILLAGYGFFLIYNLTNDMKTIAGSLDPTMGLHMSSFDESMQSLTANIGNMTARVEDMSSELKTMSGKMNNLDAMPTITVQLEQMNQSVGMMSANFDMVRRDMAMMNHSISKPMSMMNNFMPW
jgi:methyl-accepting chemotaxis protein